jgi:hypothetical protein
MGLPLLPEWTRGRIVPQPVDKERGVRKHCIDIQSAEIKDSVCMHMHVGSWSDYVSLGQMLRRMCVLL